MKTVINIMSKNPELAECKTRLKKLLSKEEREYISKIMLEMTCKVVSKLNTENILHLFPSKEGLFIENLTSQYNINLEIQEVGKLSNKIYSILNQDIPSFEKKIVIGSDIPGISTNELSECIDLLDECDCVFGPSNDGGFYLVGVKGDAHCIFKNLNMNTIILNQIVEICQQNKISYRYVKELKDIDCEKDLLFI